MKIFALGIDLGKTVFHLVGLDENGQVVVRKRDFLLIHDGRVPQYFRWESLWHSDLAIW
jgi:sugar (pentulose or hexulose) kinase